MVERDFEAVLRGNELGDLFILKEEERNLVVGACSADFFKNNKNNKYFKHGAIYILVEDEPILELPKVYVGKAKELRTRLADSLKEYPFSKIYFCTRKEPKGLDAGQRDYVEAFLIQESKKYGRCRPQNTQEPEVPEDLSPVERRAKRYTEQLVPALRSLGIQYFTPQSKPVIRNGEVKNGSSEKDDKLANVELFYLSRKHSKFQTIKNIIACGHPVTPDSKEFLIKAGSIARKEQDKALLENNPTLEKEQAELIQDGTLKDAGEWLIFTKDNECNSPSRAAELCLGSVANGLVSWKNWQDKTLKEWQESLDSISKNDLPSDDSNSTSGEQRPPEYFYLKEKGKNESSGFSYLAKGYPTPDKGFIVVKGSKSKSDSRSEIQKLQNEGVIVADGDIYNFTANYRFSRSSPAATFCLGYAASGPNVWKTEQGVTLRDWLGEQDKD